MGLQALARSLLVQLEEAVATDVGALAMGSRRHVCFRNVERLRVV